MHPVDSPGARETDDATQRESAIAFFLKHAWRFFLTPRALRASITACTTRGACYSRALHRIERRKLVVRSWPAPRRERALTERPDPSRVDPWSIDPRPGVARERAVVVGCEECTDGERDCPCNGTKRRACDACSGTGREQGVFGMRNCGRCRGRATRACSPCLGAQTPCETCAGSGRVEVWLEVECEHTTIVVLDTQSAVTGHPSALDPRDFDGGQYPYPLRENRANVAVGELPPALRPAVDARTDRVVSPSRVQTFDARFTQITYGTIFGQESFFVRPGPTPSFASAPRWTPLGRRRGAHWGLACAWWVLAVLALMLAYGRHEFLSTYGHWGWLCLLGFLATLPVVLLGGERLLLRPARSGSIQGGAAALLATSVLAGIGVFLYDAPTASSAQASLARGDCSRAMLEAKALIDTGKDAFAGRELEDAVHTAEAKAGADLFARAKIIDRPWNSEVHRAAAIATIMDEAKALARQHYRANDTAALDRLQHAVGLFDPKTDAALGALTLLSRARDEIRFEQFAVATQRLDRARALAPNSPEIADVEAEFASATAAALATLVKSTKNTQVSAAKRVDDARAAIMVSELHTKRSGNATSPTHAELSATASALREQAGIERRAAIAAKARAAAEADSRAAARDAAPLVCNDGTNSPTCRCGRASYQGCCSHHGGIRSCSM